jgi:hypothetical protein
VPEQTLDKVLADMNTMERVAAKVLGAIDWSS